jgi:hypothetical protein
MTETSDKPAKSIDWKAWTESASKTAAILAIVIYGMGYLVTSIYVAQLGMPQVNPLKPRIAAAGVLFLFLCALPIWATEEVLRTYPSPFPGAPDSTDAISSLYRFTHIFELACMLGFGLQVMFDVELVIGGWRIYTLLSLITVEFAFSYTMRLKADFAGWVQRHRAFVLSGYCLLNLAFLCLVGTAIAHNKFTWVNIAVWIYGCGIYSRAIRPVGAFGLSISWANVATQIFPPVVLFTALVYPHVRSEWGGGRPMEIVMRFSKDSPVFQSQKAVFKLVDENEFGFYVLRADHSRALFIPRADVAAISYSGNLDDVP